MNVPSYFRGLYHSTKTNVLILSNNLKTPKSYISKLTKVINDGNYSSETDFFIWVDRKNFKTNIFKGSTHNWVLLKSFLCTLGKPTSPTITGHYKLGPKGYSFGEARGFRCYYYYQIKGNYLFHSIPYYLDGTIKDSRLGVLATDGCVRLATKHAKWIYYNIPSKTSVYII